GASDERGGAWTRLARYPPTNGGVIGGVGAADVVGQAAARDVPGHGAAGVEDLRVAEAVLRAEQRGQQLAQLGTEEPRRAEAVRLEDGEHATSVGLRRRQGGAKLLAVVGVVVDDANARCRGADRLEAPRDPGESCDQGLDRDGVQSKLERDQRRR